MMTFCKTEDQVADIFTKALEREPFQKNQLSLGHIFLDLFVQQDYDTGALTY